jgi:tellurite resistance protein TerC
MACRLQLSDSMVQRTLRLTFRSLRRVTIALLGGALLVIGIAMIVLPGPASLAIPAALGILALEFEWAERWLHRARQALRRGLAQLRRRQTTP